MFVFSLLGLERILSDGYFELVNAKIHAISVSVLCIYVRICVRACVCVRVHVYAYPSRIARAFASVLHSVLDSSRPVYLHT